MCDQTGSCCFSLHIFSTVPVNHSQKTHNGSPTSPTHNTDFSHLPSIHPSNYQTLVKYLLYSRLGIRHQSLVIQRGCSPGVFSVTQLHGPLGFLSPVSQSLLHNWLIFYCPIHFVLQDKQVSIPLLLRYFLYMYVYMQQKHISTHVYIYIYIHMDIHWYNTRIHSKYINLASKGGFSKVRAIIYSFKKYLGATVCQALNKASFVFKEPSPNSSVWALFLILRAGT